MMAVLFFIFFVAIVFIAIGWRMPAMIVIAGNLVLSLLTFLKHITLHLNVQL